jgi:TPR repeat protein
MATNADDMLTPAKEPDLGSIENARLFFETGKYEEAFSAYVRLADTSYGRAIYLRLGWMYEFGMGTEKDVRKAEYWYQKAAKSGIPAGYYALAGMCFRAGLSNQVKIYMEHAAEEGYAPALFHLGQMYRFGKGVAVDEARAYEFYEKAAARGHVFARRAIAQRMIRGYFGLWRVPIGLLTVIKIMWDGYRLHVNNPTDDRLIRLA